MKQTQPDGPIVKAQMLIRRPVADVFDAFVDPAITSKFWFSKSSGRLEPGKKVSWDWEMYGVSSTAEVKTFEPNKNLLIEWSDMNGTSTMVEWVFEDRGGNATLVIVKNWGFSGTADEIIAKALDSQGGFSFLLASLKAFLEHGIELNLVIDHCPDALVIRTTA